MAAKKIKEKHKKRINFQLYGDIIRLWCHQVNQEMVFKKQKSNQIKSMIHTSVFSGK